MFVGGIYIFSFGLGLGSCSFYCTYRIGPEIMGIPFFGLLSTFLINHSIPIWLSLSYFPLPLLKDVNFQPALLLLRAYYQVHNEIVYMVHRNEVSVGLRYAGVIS